MDWLVSNANRQHRLVLKQNDSRWGISAKATSIGFETE